MLLPPYVRSRLGRREEYVLKHGFGDPTVGVDWWNHALQAEGLNQRVRLRDHRDGDRLTRQDLFQLARTVEPSITEDDVLTLLWHVLAWGTDRSQRRNRARIRAFADESDRQRNAALLRDAIAFSRSGDAESAYRVHIRRGGGQIPGLGPAFFTKLLYFASEDSDGTRCLILDARVARSLAQAGWTSLPRSGSGFSYNWYTATYASYCELLRRWADDEAAQRGALVWPDEIERALFEGEADR